MYTAQRVFDEHSQEEFARVSLDHNPIHMSAVAARRTHAGGRIVHGISALLWALNCLARSQLLERGAMRLKVQFVRPIYLGDTVSLEISRNVSTGTRIRLFGGGDELVTATASRAPMQIGRDPAVFSCVTSTMPPSRPRELTLEEMRSCEGCLSFSSSVHDIASLWPDAVAAFGGEQVAALVASSCLVGMVVPGLNSMYSGLDVCLSNQIVSPANGVQFVVTSVTERFRLVRIAIQARGIRGTLETISRPPPTEQAHIEDIRRSVESAEFASSKALVIGGSRGLGELTAKIIAAGGGDVTLTYSVGHEDAERVAGEVRAAGLKCSVVRYDIRDSPLEQLDRAGMLPTHLYYFATPHIFRRKDGLFDGGRFKEFSEYYLMGFFRLLQACLLRNAQGVRAFYPSTTAIDARPGSMTEYSMCKVAGELLCADINKFMPGVSVISRRLPLLPTDQTNSISQMRTMDPLSIMLKVTREMHQAPARWKSTP